MAEYLVDDDDIPCDMKLQNDDRLVFVFSDGTQRVYHLSDEELNRIYFWIEATGKY